MDSIFLAASSNDGLGFSVSAIANAMTSSCRAATSTFNSFVAAMAFSKRSRSDSFMESPLLFVGLVVSTLKRSTGQTLRPFEISV